MPCQFGPQIWHDRKGSPSDEEDTVDVLCPCVDHTSLLTVRTHQRCSISELAFGERGVSKVTGDAKGAQTSRRESEEKKVRADELSRGRNERGNSCCHLVLE